MRRLHRSDSSEPPVHDEGMTCQSRSEPAVITSLAGLFGPVGTGDKNADEGLTSVGDANEWILFAEGVVAGEDLHDCLGLGQDVLSLFEHPIL